MIFQTLKGSRPALIVYPKASGSETLVIRPTEVVILGRSRVEMRLSEIILSSYANSATGAEHLVHRWEEAPQ